MRIMLFFDLPTLTPSDKKNYRSFVKTLKKEGFIMLQESVYIKLTLNSIVSDAIVKKIKKEAPSNGLISLIIITERQFNSMIMISGDIDNEIIENDQRIIEL